MASSIAAGLRFKFLRVGNRTGKLGKLTIENTGTFYIVPKAAPATCARGELNVTTAGLLQVCSNTNTWTTVGTQV